MSSYFLSSIAALVVLAFISDKAVTTGDEEILILNMFNQNDCITSCSKGLNNCTDRLIMNGSVKWDLSSDYSKLLKVEVRRKGFGTPTDFCALDKTNCKGYKSSNCYCQKINTSYNIVINTTAETTFSEAELVLSLRRSGGTDLSSLSRSIPKIYGCNEVELSVNGDAINKQSTRLHFADKYPNIQFCCYNTPTPCEVSLMRNKKKLNTSVRCVSYHQQNKEAAEYTFEYAVCNRQKELFTLLSKDSSISIYRNTLQLIQYLTLTILFYYY